MPRPSVLRLRGQFARALADSRIVWAIAAVLGLRLAVLNIWGPPRPDADSFLGAGAMWLHNPSHLYDGVAAYLAQTGYGPAEGLVGPPLGAVIAAPFSLLPTPLNVIIWAVADIAALGGALLLLDRALLLTGVLRAWYWVVAFYFPPLFAETQASNITGFVFLVSTAAIVLNEARPALAGALAAMGTGLKLVPAAMVLGVGPRRLRAWLSGFVLVGCAVAVIAFGPIGLASPLAYLRDVLIPLLHSPYPDCQIVSISTLWDRLAGGAQFPVIDDGAVHWYHLAWGAAELARVLTVVSLAAIVIAAVVAARRSRWQPLYSAAVACSLGALIPGELRTYQILPLLPLILIVMVASARGRRWGVVGCLAVGLTGIVEQPCSLWFPNLWTISIVFLFAVCVAQAGAMRDTEAASG